MTIFEYVTAAILLVLGLGVTQLLSDVVDAFRRRQSYRLHWIPLTWAGIVFAWQMQFLWAVFELQKLNRSWSALDFVILLTLALLLFVAGSLIVPKANDEASDAMTQFQQDGRWALVILAVFFFLACFVNVLLFGLSFFDLQNVEDLVLALGLTLTVRAKKEKTWMIATILLGLLSIYAIIDLSPAAYSS